MNHIAPWMQTSSGRCWRLLDPQPHDVHWPDVAEHLAKIARFNGATPGAVYSVAQHCCMVADALPPDQRLAGLLHDAHEAFLGDVTSPLKAAMRHLGAGDAIDLLTTAHDRAIHLAAGMPWPLDEATRAHVHHADMRALATERRDLLADSPFPWVPLPDPLPGAISAIWPWARAATEWTTRLYRLAPALDIARRI